MMRTIVAALGLAALLAGCAPHAGMNASVTPPASPAAVQAFKAGTTNMTFSAHGTQVEYLGKDGSTALWYPGNGIVLPGRWKLAGAMLGSGDRICFQYGSNTYNPLTLQFGGGWECEGLGTYQGHVVERIAGDPFGLAKRGPVPFVLPPQRTTFAELLKMRH